MKPCFWLICTWIIVFASLSILKAQYFSRVTNAGTTATDAFLSSGASKTTSPDTSSYLFQFFDAFLSDPNSPIMSHAWDFDNDGEVDSQEINPAWTFSSLIRNRLPVKLTVSNATQSSDLIREYIEVGPRPDTKVNTETLFF